MRPTPQPRAAPRRRPWPAGRSRRSLLIVRAGRRSAPLVSGYSTPTRYGYSGWPPWWNSTLEVRELHLEVPLARMRSSLVRGRVPLPQDQHRDDLAALASTSLPSSSASSASRRANRFRGRDHAFFPRQKPRSHSGSRHLADVGDRVTHLPRDLARAPQLHIAEKVMVAWFSSARSACGSYSTRAASASGTGLGGRDHCDPACSLGRRRPGSRRPRCSCCSAGGTTESAEDRPPRLRGDLRGRRGSSTGRRRPPPLHTEELVNRRRTPLTRRRPRPPWRWRNRSRPRLGSVHVEIGHDLGLAHPPLLLDLLHQDR